MRKNTRNKHMIDVLMIIGMFFSMSFQLLGVGVHKGIGLFTFLLFVIHIFLNRQWFKSLFKGKYTPIRIAHTVTNFAVMLAFAGVMVSGVILSKELAAGLGNTMSTGRILHNASSYIGCAGIAVHIGFHLRRSKNHDDR